MKTVLSHIVQTRLSQEYENVATDALAFILRRNEDARVGVMKLLRRVSPELPELQFRTQHSVENMRPDMWGFDGGDPRVFIENKFWAGLTQNQPVNYLRELVGYEQPSLLLMVAPEARQVTIWHELLGRLGKAGITFGDQSVPATDIRFVETGIGPVLALTSWKVVLSHIEVELGEDSGARGDLNQLRALCGTADRHAFTPFASEDLSDQRVPSLVLQMEELVGDSVALAVKEGALSIDGLMPSVRWERLGRYALIPVGKGYGVWFGLHFRLWEEHGISPVWLFFDSSKWGRALEAERILAPWCRDTHVFCAADDENFAVAIDLPVGEEKEVVVRGIADRLKAIFEALQAAEPGNE
jgi:hypothetical protein